MFIDPCMNRLAASSVIKTVALTSSVPEPLPEKKGAMTTEKSAATEAKPSVSRWSVNAVRPAFSFVSDMYLCTLDASFVTLRCDADREPAYIFWSVYTALTPTLFYFSIWELAISGQEFSLLMTLAPILLGIPPFRQWAHTREGRTILHASSLLGLLAYISKSPVTRLFFVGFASSAATIGAAVEWFGGEADNVAYQALSTKILCYCFGISLTSPTGTQFPALVSSYHLFRSMPIIQTIQVGDLLTVVILVHSSGPNLTSLADCQ